MRVQGVPLAVLLSISISCSVTAGRLYTSGDGIYYNELYYANIVVGEEWVSNASGNELTFSVMKINRPIPDPEGGPNYETYYQTYNAMLVFPISQLWGQILREPVILNLYAHGGSISVPYGPEVWHGSGSFGPAVDIRYGQAANMDGMPWSGLSPGSEDMWHSFDATQLIQADIDAGHEYTSFLIGLRPFWDMSDYISYTGSLASSSSEQAPYLEGIDIIPEPCSIIALAGGLISLFGLGRRKA